jgi:hypothetical protein
VRDAWGCVAHAWRRKPRFARQSHHPDRFLEATLVKRVRFRVFRWFTAAIGYFFPSPRWYNKHSLSLCSKFLCARFLDPNKPLQKSQRDHEKKHSDGEFPQARKGLRGLWIRMQGAT